MSAATYSTFICNHIGLAGTTPTVIAETPAGYESRMGIAIFGASNLSDEEMKACMENPFHADFHDNYVSGKGATVAESLADMNRDFKEMHESLWA